jgi:hypothetical protein
MYAIRSGQMTTPGEGRGFYSLSEGRCLNGRGQQSGSILLTIANYIPMSENIAHLVERKQLLEHARGWLNAWNSRDIDRLMQHYHDDVVYYSPTVMKRWGDPEGRLVGKIALRNHFLKGFEDANHVKLELLGLLGGPDGVAMVYRKGPTGMGVNIVTIDSEGMVTKVQVFASDWPD